MRLPIPTLALAAWLASGCNLLRTPLPDDRDAGPPDAPGLDAPALDVPGLDAPGFDAPGFDAPMPDVPGLDAPLPDAPIPDVPGLDAPMFDAPMLDAPPDAPLPLDSGCVPAPRAETVCNRIDDDCDGTIDDGVCGDCVAITVLGRTLLSCPGPASGLEAWAGACRTTAEGYDLATFDSAAEQAAVQAALTAAGITESHWIGLNDFDENGTYVWRDRSTVFTPVSIGADDPQKRCVELRTTGVYEELPCSDAHRLLCEPVLPPGPCAATAEAAGCNRTDDDCDGLVDEGEDCGHMCTAATFWDSVYYVCEGPLGWDDALTACADEMRSHLAVFQGDTERLFVGGLAAESWVGLRQSDGAATPSDGWAWEGAPSLYALPPTIPPWDGGMGGQPNDAGSGENGAENCGSMRSGDDEFEDDLCGTAHDFVCEQTWRY